MTIVLPEKILGSFGKNQKRLAWCSWQKSKAIGTLDVYKHKNPLSLIVQDAIRSIYEDLSSDELLERCEGGFTQNTNKSLNAVI